MNNVENKENKSFLERYDNLKNEEFVIKVSGKELMWLEEAILKTKADMDIGYVGCLATLVWSSKNILKKAVRANKNREINADKECKKWEKKETR